MIRRHPDLAGVAATATLAAVVVMLGPDLRPLRIVFAAVLLLVLPGYALTAALFAARALDRPRRLLLTLALSLSAGIVVALLLNLTPFGLEAVSWSVALLLLTAGACAIAAARRGPDAPTARPPKRLALRDLVFVLAAAVLLGGAIALGRMPLPAKDAQGYSALWLLPNGRATAVRVGVFSGELHAKRYRLVVRIGAHTVYERRLQGLQAGTQFEHVVSLAGAPTSAPVEATLFRGGSPAAYRRAVLWRPGNARR